MINSANSSDPIPTSANTERPPPANGQAGLPAITGTAIAGPLRSSITLPATASRLASAWGIETDGCHHRMVWFKLRPVPASLPSAT